ncbi:hypothetical protein HK100_001844 [Physocladia obscura]|uniref:Uncharacterized protein n=1 Tax=Physocladia obscura TaxID=109957 RepID=A0AAD5XBI4_9FUNG|nr:hypothetical protein HK100_001844 [Physocladia obscura]
MIYDSKYSAAAIPENLDVHTVVFGRELRASNKTALVDALTGTRVSYRQMLADIDALVDALYGTLRFKKWDVVAVLSPNHMQYPIVVHAIIKAGGTVSPANPTYNHSEFAFQLEDSGAKFIFVHPAVLSVALAAAKQVGIPESRIILFNDSSVSYPGPARRTISQISSENTKAAPTVTFSRKDVMTKPAYLCYSSGTTGLPKGVETTHYNIISNVLQFEAYQKNRREVYSGDVFTGHLRDDFGTSLVFPKYELELFLKSLQKYQVTVSHIVPPILLQIAKSPIVNQYKFPKLRAFMSGAAPLAPELCHAIYDKLGVFVHQGFGLTETSPITHMLPQSLCLKFPSSIGHLIPNVQARLVSPETGLDVAPTKEGELWIRGPNVMKGYHNNPKATAESIDQDGWFHTGDIAIVDENGLFYIVDRLKELIKYKGFQVAPAELEAYLLEHPAIADVAVIGRADEVGGEIPRAFVVLKVWCVLSMILPKLKLQQRQPNVKCTEGEIIQFIDAKVSPHKKLRGGVEFVNEIPKSASGKILRRILREKDAETVKKLKAKLPC